MEDKHKLRFHISEIARILGLTEPVGFILSYEVGDIWIDIYVERDEDTWHSKTYTISVPKEKRERLKNLVESVGSNVWDMMEDTERVYASLTQEDWEQASFSIMNLL